MSDALTAWRRLQRSRAMQGWRTTLQAPGYVSSQAQPWPALRVPDAPKRVPWLRIACVALAVINAALVMALVRGLP